MTHAAQPVQSPVSTTSYSSSRHCVLPRPGRGGALSGTGSPSVGGDHDARDGRSSRIHPEAVIRHAFTAPTPDLSGQGPGVVCRDLGMPPDRHATGPQAAHKPPASLDGALDLGEMLADLDTLDTLAATTQPRRLAAAAAGIAVIDLCPTLSLGDGESQRRVRRLRLP
jgi:hypothetical protein